TCDLPLRRGTLYPAELRGQAEDCRMAPAPGQSSTGRQAMATATAAASAMESAVPARAADGRAVHAGFGGLRCELVAIDRIGTRILPGRPSVARPGPHPLPGDSMSASLLEALGLGATNSGTYLGEGRWSDATGAGVLRPTNPTTGEVIAEVQATTGADYETVIARAQEAFKVWRTTPAPRRGEAIRLCGEALRRNKDALGSLVALEMGKSKAEGDGEVQEMIDIADFAVGQSRMLYGYTMHSERPGHRMYEQYQPLGLVGIISAFNFPVAVWSWNAFLAAICGDVCIWKPSNKTPLTAIASMKICNAALKEAGFPDIFFLIND